MGQSKITTDSLVGVLLLGRLFEIDVFLHGFRASLRSSITDKVRRDFLRKKKECCQLKLFESFRLRELTCLILSVESNNLLLVHPSS